jgi:hypothetical protein
MLLFCLVNVSILEMEAIFSSESSVSFRTEGHYSPETVLIEMQFVFCEVGNACLNIIHMNAMLRRLNRTLSEILI